ncbi:MAG: FAD-binding protein [Lentisphaerae bacterium]|nr:FAD-binding protein [Lentisphaerota bacterium]
MKKLHTLVIGSGAAGLCTAVRLHERAGNILEIYTEGLHMGTSINTGSDKQTYYKLGMYGTEPDSPVLMARDLAAGGSVHGDIALVEAAMSVPAFSHLTSIGVPFPHDEFGQYIGYKTDHDPRRRATSTGPYTSRAMCESLIGEIKRRDIPVAKQKIAVKLLTDRGRCVGAVFVDRVTGEFEAVTAANVVFAVGGPGGLYETSVYPKVHTGAIGLALEAGAQARNLAESQFGLASLKFRWNVSGSYMQVLPRFVSVDENGTEREFLREYFSSTAEMYDLIFLKGYQWPFAAGHVPGSSLIDIFTYVETVERGRKVYLDYRSDPADLDFTVLSAETRDYLTKSGALGKTPLERLRKLNEPAIELYAEHNIDLGKEMLEIAVCAQHNNGGLAADIWWESVNLKRLYPVGEVNGSHGVTRPGGSALNAGQAGAFRAAERIAMRERDDYDPEAAEKIAEQALAELSKRQEKPASLDWRSERQTFQHRMSKAGAFVREKSQVETALAEAKEQYAKLKADGLGGLAPDALTETLRNEQLCLAHIFYLENIRMQILETGSRGGSIVLSENGKPIHPKLSDKWRTMPENTEKRHQIMTCCAGPDGMPVTGWEECRPVPEPDGWFETVWKEFREGKGMLE